MINLKYVKIQYFDFFGYILLTGNGYFFFNSIFSLRSKGVLIFWSKRCMFWSQSLNFDCIPELNEF